MRSRTRRRQVARRPSGAFLDGFRFPISRISSEVVMAPPTLPGFYPHSEWAALGPVHVGVRSKAQAHHWVMDLGCWVLPSNRRSLKDPPLMRSHPNKAVDV